MLAQLLCGSQGRARVARAPSPARPTRSTLQPRTLLRDQLLNLLHELRRAHILSLLSPARPDVDLVRLRFLVPDDQEEWDFLHGMFADLAIHFLVTSVDFDTHAGRPQLRGDVSRVWSVSLRDR